MPVSLKHAFQSAKADGSDTSLIQPSDWNEEHTLTASDGKLLGTSGSTTVGEITVGSGLSLSAGTLTATGGSVAASGVTFTPTGGIAATTVQTAIAELDTEKAASSHTHAQSDVTNLTTDLAAKAPLASPTFTGTPAAPTASQGNNSTQLATTAYVDTGLGTNAATSHPHAQSDVTGLTTALSGKASTGGVTSSGLTMSTATILGRTTASTGAVEEITVGSGLSLSAGTLAATGGSSSGLDYGAARALALGQALP